MLFLSIYLIFFIFMFYNCADGFTFSLVKLINFSTYDFLLLYFS